jgi:hypothetical protein
MSALVAALGCSLSAFYSFDRSLLLASIAFIAPFFVIQKALDFDRIFFHPSSVKLDFQASKEISFNGAPYRLVVIWACPVLLVLGAVELERDPPARVRVLLGRDALSDEQWLGVQTWRVWCQRG